MTSSFPQSFDSAAAYVLSQQYEPKLFVDFLEEDDSEDIKVFLVYLYGKRSTEPNIRFKNTHKGAKSPYKTSLQTATYDKYLLFGDPNSNKIAAIFTGNEKESSVLLRYHGKLEPGMLVAVIEPRVKGSLHETDNVLFTTSEPLIPCPRTDAPPTFNELPPFDVVNEPEMKFFHFKTTSLEIKFAKGHPNVCPGELCDGQLPATTCICVEKTGITTWAFEGLVRSKELKLERTSHQDSNFISVKFARFCTINHKHHRPSDGNNFDIVAFKKNNRELIKAINEDEILPGFEVMGWFKPSKNNDDDSIVIHEFHITSIEPIQRNMPNEILQLRYPRPPTI